MAYRRSRRLRHRCIRGRHSVRLAEPLLLHPNIYLRRKVQGSPASLKFEQARRFLLLHHLCRPAKHAIPTDGNAFPHLRAASLTDTCCVLALYTLRGERTWLS